MFSLTAELNDLRRSQGYIFIAEGEGDEQAVQLERRRVRALIARSRC